MQSTIRANPDEPRRAMCPVCRKFILRVGRVSLEMGELRPAALEAGLYVALSEDGAPRPLRLPGGEPGKGEAVHRLHVLECAAPAAMAA